MTDLMKELMAEVTRVNKIELEVDRTVVLQKNDVAQKRQEKAQSIALTLRELCEALLEADALKFKNNSAFFVLPGVSFKESDGFIRDVGIMFYSDGIFAGKYYSGTGTCSKTESFWNAVNRKACTQSMKALIDAWDDDMEKRVEEACMKHIKNMLEYRMDVMRKKLEKSNDEYAKYGR